MLPCNKAHSAVKKLNKTKKNTQKPQSNLFSGSIEFPCQQSDSRTSVSTNIPSILLLQPSGKRFFFPWVAPVQNQIFGDKFEFSVFTDLRVSEVSTDPFIYFRGAEYVLLLQHAGSELKRLAMRCALIVYQFRHLEIPRVSVNRRITLAKRKLQYVRDPECQENPSNRMTKKD